ncbi:MAG TPA: CBS domain-containing protein [Steroidobacteraceae bacterium]|jgi:CBS domain-containing protein
MKVIDYSAKVAISIFCGADVAEAAFLMRDQHVGFLVVYREGDDLRRPIGVLTDRDIVLKVTACGIDPRSVTVEDVMTPEPLVARDSDELSKVLQTMRREGIRRVPVVDLRGALVGIIAMDDVIGVVAGLICDMAGSIKTEQRREWRSRVA